MPELFVFLLKVNVALIVFCAGYFLVLRKLTFYTLNRIYLVTAILFSSVYPLIDVNDFALRHEQIAPVQNVIVSWKAPAANLVKPLVDYWYWAEAMFWLGAAVLAVRLMIQLISLFRLYRRSTPAVIGDHEVRVVDKDISPFSFWQSIFVNPDNLKPSDLKSVLEHEQVHVKEWHTIDVLLTEISVIFYWFNPGVWLMKKAVRENIEFITDRKILQQGADTKAYQYSLLSVSVAATTSTGIINHFNFSTLKKRIKMMNAKRSSKVNLTRYAFLVPAVVVLLFVVSLSKAEIVKQTKVAYKTIKASVQQLSTNTDTIPTKVTKTQKVVKLTMKPDTGKRRVVSIQRVIFDGGSTNLDTPMITFHHDGGADTNRKTLSIFRSRSDGDSTETYMVNGKKVSEAEFLKIAPKDIATINIMGPNHGSKDHVVLRLNKNDSKIFSDKAVSGKINIRVDTAKGGYFGIVKRDSAKRYVYSYNNGIRINRNMNRDELTDHIRSVYHGQDIKMSGRLIIIDGKQADEKAMKKLPASDIENININSGPDMVEKYGEIAKKGVVTITTKKAKK